eukprot:6911804-Heterocapsa_arctica.AAC.1
MEEGRVSLGQIPCEGPRQVVRWAGELLCHSLASDGRHEAFDGAEFPLAEGGVAYDTAEKVSNRLADHRRHG